MRDVSRNVARKISMLNKNQRLAVEAVLQGWDGPSGEFIFPIIEGPPGTGKTTVGVLSAIKYAEENRKPQIAYLAYTNYAAEKAREDFFKLGFTSDDVVRLSADPYETDWENGIVGCNSSLSDLTPDKQRRLKNTPILISTLLSSGRIFKTHNRPLIIIDEFSQVSPSLFFSTLSKVRRSEKNPSGYVLLGDPNQLPVITSQPLLRPNVGIFILSRKDYEPHQLDIQYRMNQEICQAVNALREALNSYPLETEESIKRRKLTDLGYIWNKDDIPADFQEILDPKNSCVIINTDNLLGREDIGFGKSTYYPAEAQLVARLANMVAKSYTHKDGHPLLPVILSPYSAQIGTIQSYLRDTRLQQQCMTIYKAQGREYPCVIISFTRKNPSGWIGFLKEPQLRAQTYVACSRAQAKLIILFSFSTFQGHMDYDILLEKCDDTALIINDADSKWGDEI